MGHLLTQTILAVRIHAFLLSSWKNGTELSLAGIIPSGVGTRWVTKTFRVQTISRSCSGRLAQGSIEREGIIYWTS
jgi:hypothetical protein